MKIKVSITQFLEVLISGLLLFFLSGCSSEIPNSEKILYPVCINDSVAFVNGNGDEVDKRISPCLTKGLGALTENGEETGYYQVYDTKRGKAAIISSSGKILYSSKRYSFGTEMQEGFVMVKNQASQRFGFYSPSEDEVIKPHYIEVSPFVEGVAIVKEKPDVVLLIDAEGERLIKEAEAIRPFHEHLAAVQMRKKWGFTKCDGDIIEPAAWDEVSDFKDGYAVAKRDFLYVILDHKFSIVKAYEGVASVTNLGAALFEVKHLGRTSVVRPDGSPVWVEENVSATLAGGEFLCLESPLGRKEIRNLEGEKIKWDRDVTFLEEGLLIGRSASSYAAFYLVDGRKADVLSKGYDMITRAEGSDWLITSLNKQSGIINRKGEVIAENRFDEITLADPHTAFGENEDGFFLIDEQGKETKIPYSIQYVSHFDSEGACLVKADNSYFLIGRNGRKLGDTFSDREFPPMKGGYLFSQEGKIGVINSQGDVVIKPAYDEVYADLKHGMLYVKNEENKWGYVNSEGEKVTDFKYDDMNRFYQVIGLSYFSIQ